MEKLDDAKMIAGVHTESVVVKVTPEAEQCDTAHADLRAKIANHIKMLDEAQNESVVQLSKMTSKVEPKLAQQLVINATYPTKAVRIHQKDRDHHKLTAWALI
jgi:hypothetical protein